MVSMTVNIQPLVVLLDGHDITSGVKVVDVRRSIHEATTIDLTIFAESVEMSSDGVMSISTGKERA